MVNQEGTSTIRIDELENISEDKNIYVYDNVQNTYHNLRDNNFQITLPIGEYLNRFEITFTSESLSIENIKETNNSIVRYLNSTNAIHIISTQIDAIKRVELINMLGQNVLSWNSEDFIINTNTLTIPVKAISQGAYIVKVETNYGASSSKIVVSN